MDRMFTPTKDQIANRKIINAGPFCSRRCTGIYGSGVQNGNEKLKRNKIEVVYLNMHK